MLPVSFGRPAASAGKPMLVYVGADDCAPCRVWQGDARAALLSSRQFARIDYREVKSPSLRDLLNDEVWPDDLKPYRARLPKAAGAPLWLLIRDGTVVAQVWGGPQWEKEMLPKLAALID